ncbi:LemA family protein [Pseudomonas sp. PS02302]|uniref:LemA family protein n=1 Tax=Pseudomonas sp. PS02302 TaxID=2991428 RepID=UPI00249C8DD0|nr:LemA family protein [Pseudomonas sp. PS02302]
MKLLLLLAALVALGLFAISLYNVLITARNAYRNAFAQIDVQLSRRYDLIPNLVEAVKGYLQHERETLQAVMAARQQAQSGLHQAKTRPEDPVARAALEQGEQRLGSALGRLFAVSEAYPELKANETVMQLMEELSSTENRLAYARQAHNDAVMDYNNRCETFPGSLLASRFGFRLAQPLALPDADARQAPRISLS